MVSWGVTGRNGVAPRLDWRAMTRGSLAGAVRCRVGARERPCGRGLGLWKARHTLGRRRGEPSGIEKGRFEEGGRTSLLTGAFQDQKVNSRLNVWEIEVSRFEKLDD